MGNVYSVRVRLVPLEMESRMYKPFTRTHTFSTSQRTPLQKCEGGQIHYYEENIKRISSGCVDIYTGDEMFD